MAGLSDSASNCCRVGTVRVRAAEGGQTSARDIIEPTSTETAPGVRSLASCLYDRPCALTDMMTRAVRDKFRDVCVVVGRCR